MIKVKTFVSEIKIFETMREIDHIDRLVNDFIEEKKISKVISISDATTSNDGNTIGLIRVLTYVE
ncbi:MAG: hypothetical protein ACE5FU_06710 [Nitrospinota bacterium]